MSRLHIATRGIGDWRSRLADPGRHWRRGRSAFETAVSWEWAARYRQPSQLPEPVERALVAGGFVDPVLLIAVAEHQVPLPGGRACSQCDVWGLFRTGPGLVSLAVEAKVDETFGDETLSAWLLAGGTAAARVNRQLRWDHIRAHLPPAADGAYGGVAYQLLHRCAAAVIEARRFGCSHAAFVVQAFNTPTHRFAEFAAFCNVLGVTANQQTPGLTQVGDIQLLIGWADCPFATDQQVAATA
jgi:hypothetical protein